MSHVYCAGMNTIYISCSCHCIHRQSLQILGETSVWKCSVQEAGEERGEIGFLFCFVPSLVQVSSNSSANQLQRVHKPVLSTEKPPALLTSMSSWPLSLPLTFCCQGREPAPRRVAVLATFLWGAGGVDRAAHNGWVSLPIKSTVFSIGYTVFNYAFAIMLQAWSWTAMTIHLFTPHVKLF